MSHDTKPTDWPSRWSSWVQATTIVHIGLFILLMQLLGDVVDGFITASLFITVQSFFFAVYFGALPINLKTIFLGVLAVMLIAVRFLYLSSWSDLNLMLAGAAWIVYTLFAIEVGNRYEKSPLYVAIGVGAPAIPTGLLLYYFLT
jgi:hypothetical protein